MYDLGKLADKCGCAPDEVMAVARCVVDCMAALRGPLAGIKTMDMVEVTALVSVLTAGKRPQARLLEVGTQYGLSTRIIHDVLKMRGVAPAIRTYDVDARKHLFDSAAVEFRCEDITGSCAEVLDEFKPDAVFLDAHPWQLTYDLATEARKRRLLIFMHDVSDKIWEERLKRGKLPLEGNENNPAIPWERKVLETMFGEAIHKHSHATGDYRIDIVDSCYGLAICRPI